MSPDPGNVQCSMVTDQTPSIVTIERSVSRRQRTVNSIDNIESNDTPPPPPQSEMSSNDVIPPYSLSTFNPSSSTSTSMPSTTTTTTTTTTNTTNPRRHRQRMANHYLNQIRQQSNQTNRNGSIPFHHYYHPYQHHHHVHYTSSHLSNYFGRRRGSSSSSTINTNNNNNNNNNLMRNRLSSIYSIPNRMIAPISNGERSPFLMVKILLFSLMTIDFVMNTIGLAVIIVMAKNHYANLAVERSLQPQPPLERIIPPPNEPYRNQYHHPQYGDEWTIIMPLLPSFIFVEILTLVGMFGVFCDLFSFTMTYAILKLITSLCYPSMASAAAVAAMSTATGSSNSIVIPGGGSGPTSNPHNHIGPSFFPPSAIPENLTRIYNFHYPTRINWTMSSLKDEQTETTTTKSTNIPFVWTTLPTTTTATMTTIVTTQTNETISSTTSPPTTTTTIMNDNNETIASTPETFKNYKHIRLKHDKLVANMKQMKKNEKLAKLKQREKQMRSKLLRLDSTESNDANESIITSNSHWNPLKPSNNARISFVLPTGSVMDQSGNSSQHNIKYHHRVWDALLVTFEVIFAVAFAFNTLTASRRNEIDDNQWEDEEINGGGGGYHHHRARRLRRGCRVGATSAGGGNRFSWPYSPLATSIDAFYFAQYQLPPPPPSYFGPGQMQHSRGSTNSSSTHRTSSMMVAGSNNNNSNTHVTPERSRSLLETNRNWRRFTPSWLTRNGIAMNGRQTRLNRSPSIRSNPPLYEEIEHDSPVIIGNMVNTETERSITNTTSIQTLENVSNELQHSSEELIVAAAAAAAQPQPQMIDRSKIEDDNVTNIQVACQISELVISESSLVRNTNANKTLVIAINDTSV